MQMHMSFVGSPRSIRCNCLRNPPTCRCLADTRWTTRGTPTESTDLSMLSRHYGIHRPVDRKFPSRVLVIATTRCSIQRRRRGSITAYPLRNPPTCRCIATPRCLADTTTRCSIQRRRKYSEKLLMQMHMSFVGQNARGRQSRWSMLCGGTSFEYIQLLQGRQVYGASRLIALRSSKNVEFLGQ